MQKKSTSQGLKIGRRYTKEGVSPYDMFQYEKRESVIKDPSGKSVSETDEVEVPKNWSQIAADILAQKYFRKTGVPGEKGNETSVKQVVHRLAHCWKVWGQRYRYFSSKKDADIFYDEVVYMLLSQMAAPNSPQWFNTGLFETYGISGKEQGHYYVDPDTEEVTKSSSAYERPQPHACFILSVDDDLVNEGGLMDLWSREARIFKYGSGSGTNFSNIRGENEALSGGGKSSGLMSFLKIGDRAAGAIKSGGTTRRAAKMVCLDLDHPEIEEFISWKAEEEKKVAALIAAGYDGGFEGEAYKTVSGQNSNNSVRISDDFFQKLKNNEDWNLTARTTGKPVKSIPAQKIWQQLSEAAWSCADPGVQFDTTINEWHTCPQGGKIRASNPCSEYMFLDNTACNLASINLRKFYNGEEGEFDTEGFSHACRLWTLVLEISVLMAQFPSREVARMSYEYRTIGLGFSNLGALLMLAGLPYDSEGARAMAAAVSAIMTAEGLKASAELAHCQGAFKKYNENKDDMLRVVRNHRYAAYNASSEVFEKLSKAPAGIDPAHCPHYLLTAACTSWDEAVQWGEKYGYRNAQISAIAPTGTIGLLMDCDTTGIEPDFSLVKYKKLAGGGYFKIINQGIPGALNTLGYDEQTSEAIIKYIMGCSTVKNAPQLKIFHDNPSMLSAINKADEHVLVAPDVRMLFSEAVLGESVFSSALGSKNSRKSNLLEAWGLTPNDIEALNDYVYGTMCIEGAPGLKLEHYAVFDCANRCGSKGKRFISAEGHLKMMGAVQPFISGAISKTVNLPNEASVEDISECYKKAWNLGIKACALYRDGSKYSQPLTSEKSKEQHSSKDEDEVHFNLSEKDILEAAEKIISSASDTAFKRQLSRILERKRLPSKRKGFTQKAKLAGHTIFIRTGEYPDGTLGEIFIDMYKEGASFRSLLNCFAISVSIGLQYGVPLEEFVNKFTFTRFEPAGPVDHPYIKNSTSIIDYIFKLLGYEYLNRTEFLQVKPAKQVETNLQLSLIRKETKVTSIVQEELSAMMGDAPACPDCGHITIRSGTCYRCLNCGSSLGCS